MGCNSMSSPTVYLHKIVTTVPEKSYTQELGFNGGYYVYKGHKAICSSRLSQWANNPCKVVVSL